MNGEEKMYPREQQFANLLTKQKRKWIYHPKRFEIDDTHYEPDFYLPKENLYIEVVGTRQAFHSNKEKYKKLKELFPNINLRILTVEGKPYPPKKIKIKICPICKKEFTISKVSKKSKFCSFFCKLDTMKDKTIHTRVTDEQYRKLIKIAKQRKIGLSEVIRTIVWLYTDKIKE